MCGVDLDDVIEFSGLEGRRWSEGSPDETYDLVLCNRDGAIMKLANDLGDEELQEALSLLAETTQKPTAHRYYDGGAIVAENIHDTPPWEKPT